MAHRNYDHDIQQIRAALHNPTGSRASLMVGAGFSFNAQKRYASAPDFPSWSALTESLVKRLYPQDIRARENALKNAGSTSGALRLAQEFEAAFGRTVLLNHLRDVLPDREHEPGLLHQDLLNLDWADVFTTNYDTLLERAARPLREQRYEVVRCLNDLPLKRAPRILKLHGTLPELNDCILTEEDYRTYPEKFGPFVAEVQVGMVESHLCLVGFSGDDPNFLAWSGWVRDRLEKQTLPIYLWTFDEPTTFQARMLEQRCVIPLPLSIITGESEHQAALRAFLNLLRSPLGTPKPRWCLPRHLKHEIAVDEPKSQGDSSSSEHWQNAAFVWRASRNMYPGWVVPHVKAIEDLWKNTEPWAERAESNPSELSKLNAPDSVFVLSELLWRMRRAIYPAFDQLALTTWDHTLSRYSKWRSDFAEARVSIRTDAGSIVLTVADIDWAALELRLEQLRHARETGDFDRFQRISNEIDASIGSISSEASQHAKHFQKYQSAIAYLSTWDDLSVKGLLAEWNTSSSPLWALRRAGLLIEVDEREKAEEILIQALEDLRTMADEGNSETWSIESWIICNLQLLKQSARYFSSPPSKECTPQVESTRSIESRDVVADRRGTKMSPTHEPLQQADQTADAQPTTPRDLQGTLNWLRERSCDPEEVLEWIEDRNSQEFTIGPTTSRIHSFDSRNWTRKVMLGVTGSNNRMIAAYRALRLIEDAGQPLRSANVMFAAPLAEKAIRFLADHDAAEATGAVLRLRSEALVAEWFTRQRIATLPEPEILRLNNLAENCIRRLVEQPETLALDTDQTRYFAAATELLSRVAIRLDDAKLQALLRFICGLPLKVGIWERWWLVDDIAALTRRVGEALPTSALWTALPEILALPVPGSSTFPLLPSHVHWLDPLSLFDQREAITSSQQQSAQVSPIIDQIIARVVEIGNDSTDSVERRHLLLRLATLLHHGVCDRSQKEQFARALYLRRDPVTGFPAETGCLDSLVLQVPSVDGFDEHVLFSAKYLKTDWPEEPQPLCSLLRSLARSGPVVDPRRNGRQRGINWSNAELREIAVRCRTTIDKCAQVVNGDATTISAHPLRSVVPSAVDWAEKTAECVGEVIDELLINRENAPSNIWDPVLTSITQATQVRLPILRVYPKLAAFEPKFRSIFVEEIISRINNVGGERLKHGLFALNHWANQLNDSRIPRIPYVVISAVVGRLYDEYSIGVIHIFDTIRNLIRRLPMAQSRRLLKQADSALGVWGRRLVYNSPHQRSETNSLLRAERPDLRASMTRLCVVARNRNLNSETIDRWLESVRDDPMPEIRRALAEEESE